MTDIPAPSAPRTAANPLPWLWAKLGDALDVPFRALQRHIGAHRMAYVFLLPNVLVFGIFSFWPMLLNFWIAFTGGQSVILAERPFVGLDNFRELLNCPSYLDPKGLPGRGLLVLDRHLEHAVLRRRAGADHDRRRAGHGADPQPGYPRAGLLAGGVFLSGDALARGRRGDLGLGAETAGNSERGA